MSTAPTLAAWLSTRYPAGQIGYLCLGTIDGNPDDTDLQQRWYQWPNQLDQAACDLCAWSSAQLNIYAAQCLFRLKSRSYGTALPSDKLWLDDVAIDGAELVETSPGNYQSWLQLDRPISILERRHLQGCIRDAHAGADACSKDAVHMARMPGGWHTKRQPWLVRVVRSALKIFSVDALFAQYGRPDDMSPTIADDSEAWRDPPDGTRLAQSARFLRLRANNKQLNDVCQGIPVPLLMKNGRLDTSRSNARAIFINQLIRARFPDTEVRALYLHFFDLLTSDGMDLVAFQTDFTRLWRRYQPADYRPDPTGCTLPTRQPPMGGRHYEITAAELLEYYASIADSGPTGTRADVTLIDAAAALGVSISTIRRREAELSAGGQLQRCITPDRQSSYVMIGAYVCSQPIRTPCEQTIAIASLDREPEAHVCSELAPPCPDALLVPVQAVCEEYAHGEITQPSAILHPHRLARSAAYKPLAIAPIGAAIDAVCAAQSTAAPTAEFADALGWDGGGCVPSTGVDVRQALPPADNLTPNPVHTQQLDPVELAALVELVKGTTARTMPLWALVREGLAIYGTGVAERYAEALDQALILDAARRPEPPGPDGKKPKQAVSKARGVKLQAGRALTQLVLRYVADNGGTDADPGLVRKILRGERLRADLAALHTAPAVRAALRLYETRLDRARKHSDPAAAWWTFAAKLARLELARRPTEVGKRRRKLVERIPDLRAAGEQRDHAREVAARALMDATGIGFNIPRLMLTPRPAELIDADPNQPAPIEEAGYWSQLGRGVVERLRTMKAARQTMPDRTRATPV